MNTDFEGLSNKTLHYISAINKHQSITKAAEELFISQPALSRYIQGVEGRLGFKIFNRIGNRLLPTQEGRCIIACAQKIQDLELDLQRQLHDITNTNCGYLNLAVPSLRSPYILPAIIPPFKKLYPQIIVTVHELHSKEIESVLTQGQVDFAILNSSIKNSHTVSEFIRRDEVLLAVPPDHPFTTLPKIYHDSPYPYLDAALLANETFILQHEGQRTREVANAIFSAKKINPKIFLVTRSLEAAVQMVVQGCGLSLISETLIKRISFTNPPALFSLDEPLAEVDLSLAYLDNSYHPRYFLDFMEIVHNNL